MKKSRLLTLAILTVAVAVAAGITAKLRAPKVNVSKELLFPELASRINDVSRIKIQGDRRFVELEKSGDNWVIVNADNYPALFNEVRHIVISLSQLRVLEKKTENPEFYNRLGVENPLSKDTPALLLTLEDAAGKELASLIVGKPRQSSGSKPGLYVRLPEQPHALLVEGRLDLSDEKRNWFDQGLLNIPPGRVRHIRIQHPGEEPVTLYKTGRQQPDFELEGSSARQKSVIRIILNRIATGLEELRADDVRAADNFDFPEDTTVTTVTTFDGLIVTVRLADVDDRHYARFSFSTEENAKIKTGDTDMPESDVTSEARHLNERHSGWVYVIPEFKFDDLTTSMQDINKPFQSGQNSPDEME